MALQIRRGLNSERLSATVAQGEIVWTTDTKKLYVGGDPSFPHGSNVLKATAGPGLIWNDTNERLELDVGTLELTTADISENTNLYFTSNRAKDAVGVMLQTATGTDISFTYDDVSHTISASISRETVEDTIAPLFTTGTHAGISFLYSDNGLSAGTINATVAPEYIEDIVGAMINAGVNTGITATYVDNGSNNGGINYAVTGLSAAAGITIAGSLITSAAIPPGNTLGLISNPVYVGSTAVPNTIALTTEHLAGVITGLTDSQSTSAIIFRTSQGTLSAKTALLPYDPVALIQGAAYDGTNYMDIGGFGLITDPDQTIAPNSVAGSFGVILVTKENTTANLLFNSSGVLSVPVIQTGLYDTTARDAIIPTLGMIIYNTQTEQFEGYKNTGWVSLG